MLTDQGDPLLTFNSWWSNVIFLWHTLHLFCRISATICSETVPFVTWPLSSEHKVIKKHCIVYLIILTVSIHSNSAFFDSIKISHWCFCVFLLHFHEVYYLWSLTEWQNTNYTRKTHGQIQKLKYYINFSLIKREQFQK